MKGGFDRRKSLQDLERQDWGEPSFHSWLVTNVHRLRRKPLVEFTVDDLRIMIGQRVSLSYVIPIALEQLEDDPLAEGRYYPGDLLQAVVQAGSEFWDSHADSLQRVRRVVRRVGELLATVDEMDLPVVKRVMLDVPAYLTE